MNDLRAGFGLLLLVLTGCAPPIEGPVEGAPLESLPLRSERLHPERPLMYAPGCVSFAQAVWEQTTGVMCSSFGEAVLRNGCEVPVRLYGVELVNLSGSACLEASCQEFFRVGHDPISPATGLLLLPGESFKVTYKHRPLNLLGPDEAVLVASLHSGLEPFEAVTHLRGEAFPPSPTTETFVKEPNSRNDLLIVVDDSPGMAARMPALRASLGRLLATNFARTWDMDLSVGVITTDMDHPERAGRLLQLPGSELHFLTEATPDIAQAVDSILADLPLTGSEHEQPLAAAVAAFGPGVVENAGFSSPVAPLTVLVLTDEPDQSPGEVANLVADLRATRANPEQLAIISVGPFAPGCGVPDDGRLIQASVLTGRGQDAAGVTASICDPEWESPFLVQGHLPIGLRTNYFLNSIPLDQASIDVTRVAPDGSTEILARDAWAYDPVGNAISFRDFWDLPWDTKFRVTYVAASCE